jgi:hypothetical protein
MLTKSRSSFVALSVTLRARLPKRRGWMWRWLAAALTVLAGTLVLIVSTRAAVYEWQTGHRDPLELKQRAADVGIPALQEVAFDSEPGVTIRGWFSEARNGASVILTHGSNAHRAQLLPEAQILVDAGFGILALDWPGVARSAWLSKLPRATSSGMAR